MFTNLIARLKTAGGVEINSIVRQLSVSDGKNAPPSL